MLDDESRKDYSLMEEVARGATDQNGKWLSGAYVQQTR
jgi:hypothetical protein